MRFTGFLYILVLLSFLYILSVGGLGCAQIGAPTGGTKDSIPPTLIKASPEEKSTHFTGNKITLNFNEYVEVQDIFNNVLVSPLPKKNPDVTYKLKTVTIKLKDTLLPNTTYTINFGNAIKDVNEGNVLKNFTYIFSTGNTIDSLEISGRVLLAESGETDSTIVVMLYRDAVDSTVEKRRPDYIANLNGDGSFSFHNLPSADFRLYALKDGDGSRTYNSKKELFAFADKSINTAARDSTPVILYAYIEEKEIPAVTANKSTEKRLRYSTAVQAGSQDLLGNLEILFNKPLKNFDSSKIILTDTNYISQAPLISIDSSRKKITFITKWKEDEAYRLIINKEAATDSAGVSLTKSDTLKFNTKKESEYGNLIIRFHNIDLSRNPVMQFVQSDEVLQSVVLTSDEWNQKLFPPGNYEVRILYDANKNGVWDPGNYSKKTQPEKVIAIPQKISVTPNFDNEKEITL